MGFSERYNFSLLGKRRLGASKSCGASWVSYWIMIQRPTFRLKSYLMRWTKQSRYPRRNRKPPERYIAAVVETSHDDDYPTLSNPLKSPEKDKWLIAIREELLAVKIMIHTKLYHVPKMRLFFHCKWVLKKKCGRDGVIERYNERLVVYENEYIYWRQKHSHPLWTLDYFVCFQLFPGSKIG